MDKDVILQLILESVMVGEAAKKQKARPTIHRVWKFGDKYVAATTFAEAQKISGSHMGQEVGTAMVPRSRGIQKNKVKFTKKS